MIPFIKTLGKAEIHFKKNLPTNHKAHRQVTNNHETRADVSVQLCPDQSVITTYYQHRTIQMAK